MSSDAGNVWAVPERWEAETPPPRIRVRERKRGALGVGERVLARTEELLDGSSAVTRRRVALMQEYAGVLAL